MKDTRVVLHDEQYIDSTDIKHGDKILSDMFDNNMGNIIVDSLSSKNLFNFNNLQTYDDIKKDYIAKTLTVSAYANGTISKLKEICPDMKAGETYTLSFKTTSIENFFYLKGSSSQWFNGASKIITQSELDNPIIVYGGWQSTDTFVISEIQIEKGDKATAYAPYQKYGFDGNFNYPNSETFSGRYWVDGKPIYTKTFNINVTEQKSVLYHGISNLGTIIKAYGSFRRGGNSDIRNLIPGNYTNWETWIYDFTSSSFVLYFSNNQWNSGVQGIEIVLEYTKN